MGRLLTRLQVFVKVRTNYFIEYTRNFSIRFKIFLFVALTTYEDSNGNLPWWFPVLMKMVYQNLTWDHVRMLGGPARGRCLNQAETICRSLYCLDDFRSHAEPLYQMLSSKQHHQVRAPSPYDRSIYQPVLAKLQLKDLCAHLNRNLQPNKLTGRPKNFQVAGSGSSPNVAPQESPATAAASIQVFFPPTF
jgi:hypothetical protein